MSLRRHSIDNVSRLDHAVLDAYGWTDVPTECGFLLDYPIE